MKLANKEERGEGREGGRGDRDRQNNALYCLICRIGHTSSSILELPYNPVNIIILLLLQKTCQANDIAASYPIAKEGVISLI